MTDVLMTNAAIIFVTMLALWLVAAKIGDVSFIDAVWGGGMALLAAASWLQLGKPGPRASLIAAMADVLEDQHRGLVDRQGRIVDALVQVGVILEDHGAAAVGEQMR